MRARRDVVSNLRFVVSLCHRSDLAQWDARSGSQSWRSLRQHARLDPPDFVVERVQPWRELSQRGGESLARLGALHVEVEVAQLSDAADRGQAIGVKLVVLLGCDTAV